MDYRDIADPYDPPPVSRGVFEDKYRFAGIRSFTVVNSAGECLLRTQIRAELVNDELEARLWRWLDTIDPVRSLRAI